MSKIKILYLIGSLKTGGAERQLVERVRGLDRNRYFPIICCQAKKGEFLKEVESLDIPVIDMGVNKIYNLKAIRKIFWLSGYLRKEKIQIVHTFIWQANLFGSIASRLSGYSKTVISKRNMNDWMRKRHLFVNRIANKLADKIEVNSNRVAQSIAVREFAPRHKIIKIVNGINTLRFKCEPVSSDIRLMKRKENGFSKSAYLIGCVASLSPRKGHRYLLEAAKTVVDKFPKVIFLIIGDGVLKERLIADADKMKLSDNVRFMGYREDISDLLTALDLFVLPSLEEGMSNALLEAMGSGLPVIATDVGGNSEAIEDRRSGVLIPARNADALAEKILQIVDDKNLAYSIGSEGRKRVLERFGHDTLIRETESLYTGLINNRNN